MKIVKRCGTVQTRLTWNKKIFRKLNKSHSIGSVGVPFCLLSMIYSRFFLETSKQIYPKRA